MMAWSSRLAVLKWLLLATFFSSILHYADNILFFSDYPEPVWINPRMIDLFWIVMTPLAAIGYQQIKRERFYTGCFLLVAYGLCNMLTLGHYNYAPLHSISARIHLFIVLEAVFGLALIGYTLILYWQVLADRN